MRNLETELKGFVRRWDLEETQYGRRGDATCGIFMKELVSPPLALRIIAAAGMGWDHVSVSLPQRCPTWDEMSEVHRAFFKDNEAVMQLHVPVTDHINVHPYCLHLWRPHGKLFGIPLPPKFMIG